MPNEGPTLTIPPLDLDEELIEMMPASPEELEVLYGEGLGKPATYDRWAVRSFQDAIAGSQTPPPWVIDDLLMSESATLVSAQPHAMKSLSLLQACIEAVAHQKVWKHFGAAKVRRTLFLETEDPAWMVEARIRGLAKGLEIEDRDPLDGFQYACVGPFDLLGDEGDNISRMIDGHRPDFLVLSTLQNLLVNRNWNDQSEMQPVMRKIIELSRVCPLFLVTHSPWDKRVKRAAGTVTQTANFMTTVHYEKSTDGSLIHVLVDSKVGARDTDFTLRLDTSGDARDPGSIRGLVYAGEGAPKGGKRGQIEAALQEDCEATTQEIAERVGCCPRYVQKVRRELNFQFADRSHRCEAEVRNEFASRCKPLLFQRDNGTP